MPDYPEKANYSKGVKGSAGREHPMRLLEKEELGIIAIFTAIVIVALLVTYVL